MTQPAHLLALPAEILLLILGELLEIHHFPAEDSYWFTSHTRAFTFRSIAGLRPISTVNRRFRLLCLPILFKTTRCTSAERFGQLSAECMANARFADLIRELDVVEVDTVNGLAELLPCLTSLVRVDLKADRLDVPLLAVVNSHTTLATVAVHDSEAAALRALLPSTGLSFSKILLTTTSVHSRFTDEFYALVQRGTRFSQLIIKDQGTFFPILELNGALAVPGLQHINLKVCASPNSCLPAFAQRHAHLRTVKFIAWDSLFPHLASVPFRSTFLDALRADPRAWSRLKTFTVARPAIGWTSLDEWEVVGLEVTFDTVAGIVALGDAAVLAPGIATLALVLSHPIQIHIDTLAEALSALPALQTLRLTNAYGQLHAGGPTPWIAKAPRVTGRAKANWNAVPTSGCVTALDGMRWYSTRVAERVRALEVVHVEDSGYDGRGRFGSRWALKETLRVRAKGDGGREVEVVGAPKLTMADKYSGKK